MRILKDRTYGPMFDTFATSYLLDLDEKTVESWANPDLAEQAKLTAYVHEKTKKAYFREVDIRALLIAQGKEPNTNGFIPLGSPNAVKTPLLKYRLGKQERKNPSLVSDLKGKVEFI